MNLEIGAEAAQFLFWGHINGFFLSVGQTAKYPFFTFLLRLSNALELQ
jgi:hypothetical protein